MITERAAAATRVVALLAVVLGTAGCASAGTDAAPTATRTATSSRGAAPAPSTSSRPTPTAAQVRARVDAAVRKIRAEQPSGAISVAAVNTVSGKSYSSGARSGMWTASSYKLLVVEALLLHQRSLSDYQVDQASAAIENSDNTAGYSLFLAAGGNSGLSSAASRFSMTHTVPGRSDPTFTHTSALDCVRLLRNLVRSNGPFDAGTRSFVLGLMRNVEADQRWGVGVLADRGSTFYNKNGWLAVDNSNGSDEADDDLWIASSLGIVTIKGQQVLMAVLTQHQDSFDGGVALVQRLARTIAPAVTRI